jgi:hypothetical protein
MPAPGSPADFTKPSAPRVYGYLLGGKDNFAADREKAEELIAAYPGLRSLARANRRFVLAATTWCASEGTGQFIDLGCGLPSVPMVHEVARDVDPQARCAYVDIDAIVLSHVTASVHHARGVAVIAADVCDPEAVLGDPALKGVIDLALPVCVLLGGTLSRMDADEARSAVAGYAKALAPGSAVAISCASYRDEAFGGKMAGIFGPAGGWRNVSQADVESFFAAGGLRLVRGEVADVRCWPLPPSGARRDAAVVGGVGIRP